MRAFAATVACGALAVLHLISSPAYSQEAGSLFDDTHVHDIWLDVDPGVWAALRRDYQLNTYYQAAFNFNGHALPAVGIRSRGSGSRSPEKPNLLISFDRYDKQARLFGLSAVVLKANNQDASLLRELLAMKYYRQMGVPAPREAPARLYVNGEYFGAYTLVERIDSEFLADRLGESEGYLYEWEARRTVEGYRFEYLGPDPENYSPILWSPSNNESNPDPAPIVAMTDLINNSTDEEFAARIEEYIDIDRFLRFIAVENFVGDFDGMLGTVFGMNNFYAYRFGGTTRFLFIPWDKDYAFDSEYKPIFEGVSENVLARRLLAVPQWRSGYLRYLSEVARLSGDVAGGLSEEIDRLYALIRDSAVSDPHKQCTIQGVMLSCGPEDVEAGVEHLRVFARTRASWVLAEVQSKGGG